MGLLSRLLAGGTTARDPLVDLAQDYRDEAEQAARLRQHAERARYPQVAEALRRLAEIEDRHAGWLRDRLVTLGGRVPALEPAPATGNNQWERAVAALQVAQGKRRRLIEQIARWDPDEPELVELLGRIEQEDTRTLGVYEDIVMRSDPQSHD
jgi:rubrerythrin